MENHIVQIEPKELIRAKQLVIEGKFDGALQLMKNFEKRGDISLQDLLSWHLVKCHMFLQQYSFIELIELAEKTYKESLGLGKSLLSVDALYYIGYASGGMLNLKKADEIIKQGEDLLKTLTNESLKEYKKREANIAFLKGTIYDSLPAERRDPDLALEQFEKSLELREKYGDKHEVAASFRSIAGILMFHKGELDQAFEYLESALTLAKESKMKFQIADILFLKAVYFGFKGELDRSIMLNQQSLVLFKELNNKVFNAFTLNNLTDIYTSKGELGRALECIEQSIALFREILSTYNLSWGPALTTAHANLIHILIEKGDLKRAQEYLNQLEQMDNELKTKLMNLYILECKASILKASPRIVDKGKAQEILKQILEDEDSTYQLVVNSLLDLCELLLFELDATNEPQILDEFQSYLSQLINIVKNGRSYRVLAETYLLQARVSLLTLNMNKARRLFAKSQDLAESFGLTLLARRISNEHDKLLKQLSIWENLKESNASLNQRIELARLNEQMENMIQKREIIVPELTDEDPIVLLIISEGGKPLFSESFAKEWAFEDHLFGGFLTAINSFSGEMFSEGLNRANFGEYTIIMNSMHPFLVCYLFKGQSYLAQQRVAKFIDHVKEDGEIWEKFNKFNQACQLVQLKDIPSLKPLINEIFVDKSIPLIA